MSPQKQAETSSKSALTLVLIYLACSFFGAIFFGILFKRSRINGNLGIIWAILTLLFIVVFSMLSYAFVKTSSPSVDAFWYYLGLSSLCANGIASLIFLSALFHRN
ncbi:MAG: hypothetical protein RLZZ77_2460 [Bacteroidota bacterium]|jgi:hypothetical protein